jgi:hypothetical protein
VNLIDRCKTLFDKAKQGEARLPTWVEIPAAQIDQPTLLGPTLRKDAHYFQVQVDELFLASSRQWWVQYNPLVFAHTEFIYDKATLAVPFVVGPGLVEKLGQKVPGGMIFADTRVAGVHPYRGDRIALTLILYRAQHQNWSRSLLGVIETAAGALDFATSITAYTKVAGAVLDGVEALVGLGNMVPVAGYRIELGPQPGLGLAPRYFALIDQPAGSLDTSRLRVVGGRLHDQRGPYRDGDFVLYSLRGLAEREDEALLPFYPQWERVQQEAASATDEGYRSAKSNMLALYQAMLLSPDLTDDQAEALTERYVQRMQKIHERATGAANLAPADAKRADEVRQRSMKLLDL